MVKQQMPRKTHTPHQGDGKELVAYLRATVLSPCPADQAVFRPDPQALLSQRREDSRNFEWERDLTDKLNLQGPSDKAKKLLASHPTDTYIEEFDFSLLQWMMRLTSLGIPISRDRLRIVTGKKSALHLHQSIQRLLDRGWIGRTGKGKTNGTVYVLGVSWKPSYRNDVHGRRLSKLMNSSGKTGDRFRIFEGP